MTPIQQNLSNIRKWLAENDLKSAGYYEAVWNASNHASGLYIIRMNAYGLDNKLQFNKLQKIMLVK